MDLLAELNSLRAVDGKVPLKTWTGDEDQLKAAILARKKAHAPQKTEEELIDEYLAKGGDIKVGREASAKGVRRQGGNRHKRRNRAAHHDFSLSKTRLKDGEGKVKAPVKHRPDIPADCFTLSELAHDRDTSPRYVRSLARRKPSLAGLNVKELGRWVFRLVDRDRVWKILWPNG